MPHETSQALTDQESHLIQDYLSRNYAWPVEFSLAIRASETSSRLKNAITLKDGLVLSLVGETVYYQQPHFRAQPLRAVAEGEGLFILNDEERGDVVYLELVRVTDLASELVPA